MGVAQGFVVGPIEVRFDFLLVVAGVSFVSSPVTGAAFALVILVHELGHAVVARLGGADLRLLLQLAGGRVYGQRSSVLLAGPVASGLLIPVGAQLMRSQPVVGYALFYAAVVWTGYQLAPFPPLDGGQILQRLLSSRIGSAVWTWRLSWLLGFVWVAAVVLLDPGFVEPCVWLTGVALILGRGEAGYVRHLDAYSAWERGDHREVVKRATATPDYLDKRDRVPILALGVTAALELEDESAIQHLAGKLPPGEPAAIEAATWLLMREKAYGAKLAERALDALNAERVKRRDIDEERWSEMVFRLSVYEAANLNPESALGLLERAIELGYENRDRIEAEPAFSKMKEHPRWEGIVGRLRA